MTLPGRAGRARAHRRGRARAAQRGHAVSAGALSKTSRRVLVSGAVLRVGDSASREGSSNAAGEECLTAYRGTVRRVCIVSDTKVFLLNEDYVSDGHKSLDSNGDRVGEVSYEVVDEATLSQVAEVQAAGADPRSITLIINPLSRLSRTHRWRLCCRDSDGTERLVADVRRAIDMQMDVAFN